MIERYIPDINFGRPLGESIILPSLEDLHCELKEKRENPVLNKFYEYAQTGWNFSYIIRDFRGILEYLGGLYDRQFSWYNMDFRLVDREILQPKTQEKETAVRQYGQGALEKETMGDCERMGNRNLLRIGFAGLENDSTSDEVLETSAHEYGHTLGLQIDQSVIEELKAYSFEALVMRIHNKETVHLIDSDHTGDVHDSAIEALSNLQARHVTEEEILWHLTGERFGNVLSSETLVYAIADISCKTLFN